jgi:hypothetical protein
VSYITVLVPGRWEGTFRKDVLLRFSLPTVCTYEETGYSYNRHEVEDNSLNLQRHESLIFNTSFKALNPCSRVLGKLLFPQIVILFPTFVEPAGYWLCSQRPSTCPRSEPDQFSPHLPFYHFNFNILHLPLRLPVGLFPSGITAETLYAFLFFYIHARYFALVTFSILSTEKYLAKRKNHEALNHAIFSSHLLLLFSWAQVTPSVSHSLNLLPMLFP